MMNFIGDWLNAIGQLLGQHATAQILNSRPPGVPASDRSKDGGGAWQDVRCVDLRRQGGRHRQGHPPALLQRRRSHLRQRRLGTRSLPAHGRHGSPELRRDVLAAAENVIRVSNQGASRQRPAGNLLPVEGADGAGPQRLVFLFTNTKEYPAGVHARQRRHDQLEAGRERSTSFYQTDRLRHIFCYQMVIN